MPTLDHSTCNRLLEAWPVGRLATVTAEGAAHVVPCCFVITGDRLYSAVDGKPKSTDSLRRLDNVRANPTASLVIDHYAEDWNELWWVRVDGVASVVEPDRDGEREQALTMLAAKYHQYRNARPQGPLLRVEVVKISGWAYDLDRVPPDGAEPVPGS